jgi:hypothetical protein
MFRDAVLLGQRRHLAHPGAAGHTEAHDEQYRRSTVSGKLEAQAYWSWSLGVHWQQILQVLTDLTSAPAIRLCRRPTGTASEVADLLGLGDSDYSLTGRGPTQPALVEWFRRFGIRRGAACFPGGDAMPRIVPGATEW